MESSNQSFLVGYASSHRLTKDGVRNCRLLRAIQTGLIQWPSHLTAGYWHLPPSGDGTVRLWDMASGAQQQLLEGHTDWVRSVAFSPNSRLLASASSDTTVRLWDTASGTLQQTLSTERMVTELEFSQNGSHLSTNLGVAIICRIHPRRIQKYFYSGGTG